MARIYISTAISLLDYSLTIKVVFLLVKLRVKNPNCTKKLVSFINYSKLTDPKIEVFHKIELNQGNY